MNQENRIVKCEAYESNIAYLFEASDKSVIICPIKSEECPYQKSNIIEYETEQIGICGTSGWIMNKEKGRISEECIKKIKERLEGKVILGDRDENKCLDVLIKMADSIEPIKCDVGEKKEGEE